MVLSSPCCLRLKHDIPEVIDSFKALHEARILNGFHGAKGMIAFEAAKRAFRPQIAGLKPSFVADDVI